MERQEHQQLKQLIENQSKAFEKRFNDFEHKFEPVLDLYNNANTFATWVKRVVIFISVVLGILVAWKQLKMH